MAYVYGNYVITTAGLAAATTAGSGGPKIDIVAFKLGSAANYEPTEDDTGLNGSTVFSGTPSAVTPFKSDTMDIILQLAATVGPFQFGEIGLYLPGDVLFAKAVYQTLQSKINDPSSGVGSLWTYHNLIKLADAQALFNYTVNQTNVSVVQGTALTGPQATGLTTNAIIAMDYTLSGSNTPIFCFRRSTLLWAFAGYRQLGAYTVQAAAGLTITQTSCFGPTGPASSTTPANRYLLQSTSGEIVPIASVNRTTGVATLARAAPWLGDGVSFRIYDSGAPNAANVTPLMNGTATGGDDDGFSRSDHVHPTDTSRAPVNNPSFTGDVRQNGGITGGNYPVGFRGRPPRIAPYLNTGTGKNELQLQDNGFAVCNVAPGNGGTGTLVVPSFSSNSGMEMLFINNNGVPFEGVVIEPGPGVTLRLAGVDDAAYVGARTLGPKTVVQLYYLGPTEVWMWGVGKDLTPQSIPTGAIMSFAGTPPASEWAPVDGTQVLAISPLGDLLGTTFNTGGETSGYVRVPDLRGYFLRVLNTSGSGVDPSRTFGSIQLDDLKAHVHEVTYYDPDDVTPVRPAATGSGGPTPSATTDTASTGGTETRPKNRAFPFFIKK